MDHAVLRVSWGCRWPDAARLFAYFQVVQLVAMLSLPTITDFTRDRRSMLAVRRGLHGVGGPADGRRADALALLATGLFGFGVGGGSALVLVLLVGLHVDAGEAARLGAMMMMVAFLAGRSDRSCSACCTT